MIGFQSFEVLACWKEAKTLRNLVKDSGIPTFPSIEKFALTLQIKINHQDRSETILQKDLGGFIFKKTFNFAELLEDL